MRVGGVGVEFLSVEKSSLLSPIRISEAARHIFLKIVFNGVEISSCFYDANSANSKPMSEKTSHYTNKS